jgi:hypothetical protein
MYQFARITCSLLLLTAVVQGANPPEPSPTLQQLTRQSSYIFAGTVLTVEPPNPNSEGELPTVRITFRIDQAIRGVRAKQIMAIKEWAGLWEAGERYRAGERLLLFLHGTSKLGLTSPVNGALGCFQLDRNCGVLLDVERIAALQTGISVKSRVRGKPVPINNRAVIRAILRKAGE